MGQTKEIVIVGGGPAGAFCAYELAKRGIFATVFDSSHPREKPCGGGISPTALEKFLFLEQFRTFGGSAKEIKMISCTDMQEAVLSYRGFCLSRKFFDQQLIKMATDEGASLVKEKVLEIQPKRGRWQLKTDKGQYAAGIVVGADGINSLVRKATVGRILPENLGLAYGYIAQGVESNPVTVKFTAEIPGYIWIFPRKNNTCIGIGSELKYGAELKKILDQYLGTHYPELKVISTFAAMLPWATNPDFFSLPASDDNWALVGDAAGHADPLTGEGILYALWSGKLAAEAIGQNDLRVYDKLWRKQYSESLNERCRMRNKFYDPCALEFSIATHSLQKNFKFLT
jgi:geranylgeranyl reductase family protein